MPNFLSTHVFIYWINTKSLMLEDKKFNGTLVWLIIIILAVILVYILYSAFWKTTEEVKEGLGFLFDHIKSGTHGC